VRDFCRPIVGTPIAVRRRMTHDDDDLTNKLLADIHRSLERLAGELTPDRPDLAFALRKEASLIPRPEPAPPARSGPPATCLQLGPLLYRALDEGLVPHRRFDALMVRRVSVMRGRR
jgi:hypothetical protein